MARRFKTSALDDRVDLTPQDRNFIDRMIVKIGREQAYKQPFANDIALLIKHLDADGIEMNWPVDS